MPTYLYCLMPAADAADPGPRIQTGIGGGPVRVLAAGPLEAWVSTVAERTPRRTAGAAREHDAVVSAALATGRTPLPARFGQTWPSDAACAASVTQRAAELASMLRHLTGLVEMTVCTLLPGLPVAPRVADRTSDSMGPGTAYLARLRARAGRERHLRAVVEALRTGLGRALGPIARGEVANIRGSGEALALSVSYLIERSREADFRRAVDEVAREAAARLVVAGPRAPYSFAPAAPRPTRGDAPRAADVP